MTPALRRQAVVIVTTLAIGYVASIFFRAANATLGLELMRDLRIGPEALGVLTGAFFFGFSGIQLPCGFFFDRYGPRRTVFCLLLLATAGGLTFVLAPNWPVLLTGRTMMGAGFAGMYVGSMVVVSRWFPADEFSTICGRVMSIGLIGNLLATTPLAWGADLIGWRAVLGLGVGFTAVSAAAVWLVVRDAPPGHPFLARRTESPAELLVGMAEVLRVRNLHFILAMNFCYYAMTFTVQGLWAGPFLREVHGLSKIQSGNVLLASVVAYQVGMLMFPPLDRMLDTRKWISLTGGLCLVGMLATLALWREPPVWVPVMMVIGIGLSAACSTMTITHGRASIPDRLVGRAIGVINTAVMAGAACMQAVSGVIIGLYEPLPSGARPEIAYRSLFGVMGVVMLLAIAIYSRAVDVRPSEEMRLGDG